MALPNINHFSKFICLIRSTGWVLLSVNRWKGETNAQLTPALLDEAEKLWIKRSQQDFFGSDIRNLEQGKRLPNGSRLAKLSPTLDREGLLRVDGRINAVTEVPNGVKSPLILHGNHRFTWLLVQYHHARMRHGSPETVVNELKQRYWIIKIRATVRSVSAQCQWCRVQRGKPQVPRMGDSPMERLGHHRRPFTFCGVDYFGPMMVMVGRRREKRWGVLFTYLTTRAVHLELAATLSTDSAIMSLRRMMGRRGNPSEIFSDNGTNLTGMNTELQKAIKEIDQEYVKSEMMNQGIQWRFIPPSTPHMGGSWERLVRSVKVTLSAVSKERVPREEVLATLLIEAEHVVNSRPLTHVSVDHRDAESLTPNHFLLGSSSGVTVPGRFTDQDLCSRKHWRQSQRLADMFWARWLKEYLPNLVSRKCWVQEVRALSEGDVVHVVDSTLPRNVWLRGEVTKVYPGKDGRIRVVDVRIRGRIFKRASAKIVVLVPATERV